MIYPFKVTFRIAFRDVDMHGILHHSHYLHYFEMGRVELLRAAGITYDDVMNMGVGLLIAECSVKYISPISFDDELVLNIGITGMGESSFKVIYSTEVDGKETATGFTSHVCVSMDNGKPTRVPEKIRIVLQEFISAEE